MVRSAAEVDRLSQQALETLEQELPIAAAFLFGSYVEGGAHEGSDIDLAIFTPERSRLKIAEKSRLQLHVQRQCALDLELHLYPADALDEARRTNFYGYLLEHGKRLR
ncbi:MAG: nucleotidyltransferase domain-containing protein [Pirellulales bacterium]